MVLYGTRPEVRPELVIEVDAVKVVTVKPCKEADPAKVTPPPKYEAPAATYKEYALVIVAKPPATGALARYSVAAVVYVVTLFVDNVGWAKL